MFWRERTNMTDCDTLTHQCAQIQKVSTFDPPRQISDKQGLRKQGHWICHVNINRQNASMPVQRVGSKTSGFSQVEVIVVKDAEEEDTAHPAPAAPPPNFKPSVPPMAAGYPMMGGPRFGKTQMYCVF